MKRNAWQRFLLHLDTLDRYHSGASLILMAGSVGMIATSLLTLGPLWVGFLAGVLPTFMLVVLIYPVHA